MSFISVFDVMGPNMIGPSSSHTAGAARIAYLAQKMINGPLAKVEFILYGSFARTYHGHGTDRALLGGIMGFSTDDMRIRNSFEIATENGLKYSFTPNGGWNCQRTSVSSGNQLHSPLFLSDNGCHPLYVHFLRVLPDSMLLRYRNLHAF